MPTPPENGLIIRGFCTYMKAAKNGTAERARRMYYEKNPDAWAAETQSDMLWLTEAEWRSLIPADPRPGVSTEVDREIQRRLFSTIGIDYMEGSVNALPVRDSKLTISTGKAAKDGSLVLGIEGSATMGKAPDASTGAEPRTRGCKVQITGRITYDTRTKRITAFDLAGIGEAWGNKMEYTKREIGIPPGPWLYGIACELVSGNSPYDRVPPYNMLHYGGGMKYFGGEKR